jgi:hypothetical protein
MNGIYWLLVWLPLGATTFLLYALTLGMIFYLRDTKEGLFYNTSYSAMIGDGALLSVVVMAIGILKQGGIPPAWMALGTQIVFCCVGIIFGVAWYLCDQPKCPADQYHHLVIAPMLFFLLFTLVPLIIKCGTKIDVGLVSCFVAIWGVTLVFDVLTERLDQRRFNDLGDFLDDFRSFKDKE